MATRSIRKTTTYGITATTLYHQVKSDGSVVVARTSTGVSEWPVGSGCYEVTLSLDDTKSHQIAWDDGTNFWEEDFVLPAEADTSGGGAYARDFIVVDSSDAPIDGAILRATKGAETPYATTDSDGECSLSLDAGTWTISITAAGHQFSPTTLVVSGSSVTPTQYTMTQYSISLPSEPGRCVVYGYTRNGAGAAVASTDVEFKCRRTDITTGAVISESTVTATSDSNGYFEIELSKNWEYDVRTVGTGRTQRMIVGDDDSQEVCVVIA